MKKISPSIFSADLTCLKDSILHIEHSGGSSVHIDVLDGHFVPTFGFNAAFVKSLKQITSLPLEVHLQVQKPQNYIDQFVEAGADSIVFHPETAGKDIPFALQKIKKSGLRCGLAIAPYLDIEYTREYLPLCDEVIVLSVRPGGFPSEAFQVRTYSRIKLLRSMGGDENLSISVDGEIGLETGRKCIQSGADKLVIGKSFFAHQDSKQFVKDLIG